jgi:NAD(P)-dependent dehydrogenase (short-subunit alcohol dehydrogenase family)
LAEALLALGGAAIILTSSIVGSKGLGANSVYAATKAVVRSFARTWTTDLKHRRIRVNAISPGSIDTPGLAGWPFDGRHSGLYNLPGGRSPSLSERIAARATNSGV